MFGRTRGRVNSVPDSGFVDGSTAATSAADSPLITEGITAVRPVRQDVYQPDGFATQNMPGSGDWLDTFAGVSSYIDQTAGGQPGNRNQLGFSTGLRPRKESRTPLTGRVLVLPAMQVHPTQGVVGRDNRANSLFAAVASQTADYLPTTEAIAAQFTGRGLVLET